MRTRDSLIKSYFLEHSFSPIFFSMERLFIDRNKTNLLIRRNIDLCSYSFAQQLGTKIDYLERKKNCTEMD